MEEPTKQVIDGISVFMMLGTLGAIEMSLRALKIPHGSGGVQAAIDYLADNVSI